MRLRPDLVVTPAALAAGEHALVMDSAWASLAGAFYSGVILVAFALALGANPMQIGLLAAIPFAAQASQLPATLLVDRIRQRRKIAVLVITAARVLILLLAAIAFVPDAGIGLTLLISAQVLISVLHSTGACAVNSWLHQLIPRDDLGRFFSRRLLWGTTVSCAGTLAAGALIEHLPVANPLHGYAAAFVLAGLAGFVSSHYLARAPEPVMPPPTSQRTLRALLLTPFQDVGFRKLLIFQAAWNIASNLAAPFFAVYLIRQLGYPLTTVTGLWVTSQVANALTIYLWGRLSDRLSNKAILAVVLPAYFACTLALVFGDAVKEPALQLSLLVLIHVVMGVASGGIGLAMGNLGLKLAPQGQGTAYLAAIGLVSAVAGGLSPLIAGMLAHSFETSELTAVLRFASPSQTRELTVLQFAHWEFLFALSALAGLYVMHALSRIKEVGKEEISEGLVMQEFALEAIRSLDNLSSVGGALGALFPFDRLFDRGISQHGGQAGGPPARAGPTQAG
jgi:MFS family permease